MRRLALFATFLVSTAVTAFAPACNEGELDCRELCNKAQDGDCTSITGDCDDFCEAMTNIQDEASCADEREAYADCLNDEGVCGSSCDGSENALTTCLGAYCATRLTDPDCATLIDSF